jgi:hypothetical protein
MKNTKKKSKKRIQPQSTLRRSKEYKDLGMNTNPLRALGKNLAVFAVTLN